MTRSLVAAVSLTAASLPAFAQDTVPAEPPPAQPAPEAEAAPAPVETPQTPQPAADTGDEFGGIIPGVRFGPSVDVSLPHPVNLNIDATILGQFGIGVRFGVMPKVKVESVEGQIRNWNVTARWFPFSGSFFLGLGYGKHEIEANAEVEVPVTAAGQTVNVPVTAEFEIEASTLIPHLGWFATWDSGFTLGTEFGIVVPSGSDSTLKPTTTAEYEQYLIAASATQKYRDAQKDAEDFGKQIGDTTLPYWNILRIGWLF